MLIIRKKNIQKGFSLIELMVAVAILAMAIFGIFLAYSTGFMGMADARDRTVAVNYAREIMEKIRNDTSLLTGIDPYDEDKYHIEVIITSDPTDVSLNRVTTEVSWLNRNGDTKKVELEMLVYNPEVTTSPPDPDVTSIEVVAYPDSPICCETSVIQAEVYEGHGGNKKLVDYSVLVSFSTTMGSLSADDAFTYGGIATVNLTLDNPDIPDIGNPTGKVTAIVGSLSDYVNVPCIPPVITVNANPLVIFSGETSDITATLEDADNNLLESKTVKFTIISGEGILDGGTTTAYSNTGTGIGENDVAGVATVVLSDTTEGDIKIEASYCNFVSDPPATVTCTTLIIEVTASNDYVSPGGTSTITATLTDGLEMPAVGKTIDFNTVYSGGSWGFDVNGLGETDENGVVTAELSVAQLGTATVTGAYGSLEDTVTVTCTTFVLEVNASDEVIAPGGISTITATLTDGSGNPIEGETIDFSAVYDPAGNPWTLTINNDGVTDENGVATAELSNAKVGTATVTGAYGSTNDDVMVTCTALNIVVIAAEDTIGPDVPCTITATLTDAGIPVEEAVITFDTTYGALYILGSTTETTSTAIANSDGVAQVDLIFSVDDDGETATITGSYSLVSDTTTVTCSNITITPTNIRYWRIIWIWTDYKTIEVDIDVEGGTLELQEMQVSWVDDNGEKFQSMQIGNGSFTTVYDNGNASSGEIVDIDDYTLNEGNYDIRFWWGQTMQYKSFTVTFNPISPSNPDGENIPIEFDSPD